MDGKKEELLAALQNKASQSSATLVATPEGFRIVPVRDGQPLQPQQIGSLSGEDAAIWKKTYHDLQHELNEVVHDVRKLELEALVELEELERRVASSVVDVAMEDLKSQFGDYTKVLEYLEQVHSDILDNVDLFRSDEEADIEGGMVANFRVARNFAAIALMFSSTTNRRSKLR